MANISYIQLFQPGAEQVLPTNLETSSQSPPVSSPLPDNAVTITSPTEGQQVPIGENLVVAGTSIATSDSGCKIHVNLNRARPSQPATATGPGGATLTSNYTSIQEGQNRIGARISCGSDSTLRQFTGVNVTGVR
jgi:hypothetical protein